MSMILGLVTLADANVARVLKDPPLVLRVIAPDDPEAYEEARESSGRSLLGRLFGRKPPELRLADGEGVSADLDKAWHGIHYLLTGTAREASLPLGFLVQGGREVGDVDVGYGPARVFTAAETRQIDAALAGITDRELSARFDPADMLAQEVYPGIWDRKPEDDDPLGYLMEYVASLRAFVKGTVESGMGLVVFLS